MTIESNTTIENLHLEKVLFAVTKIFKTLIKKRVLVQRGNVGGL